MTKVSAVLITKNEERVISRCIKSLSGVDEVVILDTGSTDKTVEIARSMGAKVQASEPMVPFHFALARNVAHEMASNDWILAIDADEVLRAGMIGKIKNAINIHEKASAFLITFTDRGMITHKKKLYKKSTWSWKYRVHEALVPIKQPALQEDLGEVVFEHLPAPDKKIRQDQNIELLKMTVSENPEYARAFRHLGQELMLRKEWKDAIPHLASYLEKTEEAPLEKSEVACHLGRCYVELSMLDDGLKWFEQAAQIDQRRREPFYHGALALIKAARLEEAASWAEGMLKIKPDQRPNSRLDIPGVWGMEPIRMLAFCRSEIARAKSQLEAKKS